MSWIFINLFSSIESVIKIPIVFTDIPKELKLSEDCSKNIFCETKQTRFWFLKHYQNSPKLYYPFKELLRLNKPNEYSFNSAFLNVQLRKYFLNKPWKIDQSKLPNLQFYKNKTKSLKVKFNANIQCELGYEIYGSIKIWPSTINIVDKFSSLAPLKFIETEKLELQHLNKTIIRKVKLAGQFYKQKSLSKNYVWVKIPIAKVTEKEVVVPIKVLNKPKNDHVLILPKQVNVKVKVLLEDYESVTGKDMNVQANYFIRDEQYLYLSFKKNSKKIINYNCLMNKVNYLLYR